MDLEKYRKSFSRIKKKFFFWNKSTKVKLKHLMVISNLFSKDNILLDVFPCASLFSKSEIMLIVYTFVWHLSCSKLTDHSTNSFSHFLYQRTSHFNLVEAALQYWLLQHEIEYGNIYIKQHCKNSKHEHWTQFSIVILLPKLFWPTVRKNCSSDQEKILKFEAEG